MSETWAPPSSSRSASISGPRNSFCGSFWPTAGSRLGSVFGVGGAAALPGPSDASSASSALLMMSSGLTAAA